MTEAAAKPAADTETKKKRKKRFPAVGDFANKGAYFEAMIKLFQEKLAHWKKFGDGETAKKVKMAKKVSADIDELMKDPACSDVLMEIRKKLSGKGAAPAKPATT